MTECPRVLVVEDEADIRDGVSRWLCAAGDTTITASDGVEGLRAATESPPDAILLDVRMPRLNGMQVLDRLRRDERTRQVPIVMLSASLRDEQQALDAGARFFIHKPYHGRELLKAIGATLTLST